MKGSPGAAIFLRRRAGPPCCRTTRSADHDLQESARSPASLDRQACLRRVCRRSDARRGARHRLRAERAHDAGRDGAVGRLGRRRAGGGGVRRAGDRAQLLDDAFGPYRNGGRSGRCAPATRRHRRSAPQARQRRRHRPSCRLRAVRRRGDHHLRGRPRADERIRRDQEDERRPRQRHRCPHRPGAARRQGRSAGRDASHR